MELDFCKKCNNIIRLFALEHAPPGKMCVVPMHNHCSFVCKYDHSRVTFNRDAIHIHTL